MLQRAQTKKKKKKKNNNKESSQSANGRSNSIVAQKHTVGQCMLSSEMIEEPQRYADEG
jgi:hypothetical protein